MPSIRHPQLVPDSRSNHFIPVRPPWRFLIQGGRTAPLSPLTPSSGCDGGGTERRTEARAPLRLGRRHSALGCSRWAGKPKRIPLMYSGWKFMLYINVIHSEKIQRMNMGHDPVPLQAPFCTRCTRWDTCIPHQGSNRWSCCAWLLRP